MVNEEEIKSREGEKTDDIKHSKEEALPLF